MTLSDSPFTNRLNTNYVPSNSEILEIRSLLVDPLEEIARIDGQIEEMELALAQLKAKRALLLRPIDAHRALISPMRFIPHDVLLEIFFACLPSEHNALIDPAEAPLLLGRICRHWRSVAYSTPMLWSSIHIPPLDYLDTPPNIFRRFQGVLETWFERSATCPLSVSLFDFTNRVEFIPDLERHPLAPQILAVSYRLRYLALAGDAELLRPILQLGPADFPLLKSMRMKSLSTQTPCTNILEVPTLEDVTLYMTGSNDPLSLPLRWLQLRRLRLECFIEWPEAEGGLGIDGALQVLRMCPNLEWCELRVTKHSEHSGLASNMTPIILPQLHTLVLSGWEFHFDKWIDLVAPNLRSLQIGQINSPPNPSQSNSRRLTVDLDFTRFTTRSLQEILRSLPMISHLQLVPSTYEPDYMTLDDEFMTLFSPPHNLCPMLIDIELVLSPSSKFSDVALLAFIKARTIMPTPLQRVQAYFNRSMELDLMPELQSFISDGLQVTLQYPPSQYAFRARDGLEGPGAFY